MKKMLVLMIAAMMTLSFSVIAFAEKTDNSATPAKTEKREDAKNKKDNKKKKEDEKPAAKGKKEVSGC